MRRAFAIFALLLLSPQNFETSAREVLDHIVKRDFDAAAKNFSDMLLTGLTPAKLKDVYEKQLSPELGAFESAGAPISSRDGDFTVVTIPARFEKATMNFVVAFDAAGKVAALWFKPSDAKPPEPAPTRFADYETKARLRLPFDGEWLVVWGGRTLTDNYHVISVGQRFAYDFLIRRNGSTHSGAGKDNAEYYCWDAPILAPADGVVVTTVDGIADNAPGVMNPLTPVGNHIVIDHGNGEHSLFAHFRKGSIVPKVGDRVKRGQLLGRCGNSGNSSEPHLHYHLQTARYFGEGEGLPAQFNDYVADGKRVRRGEPVRGQVVRNR